MIIGIHHVAIGVPDFEAGLEFYTEVLGFEQVEEASFSGPNPPVEAAIGLAKQPGNTVTISYRKAKFFRIKTKNQERFQEMLAAGKLNAIFDSNVKSIGQDEVRIETKDGVRTIPNSYVFIFAGGIPPFALLREIGIGFGQEETSSANQPRTNECA